MPLEGAYVATMFTFKSVHQKSDRLEKDPSNDAGTTKPRYWSKKKKLLKEENYFLKKENLTLKGTQIVSNLYKFF